jgi:hypothetical protein
MSVMPLPASLPLPADLLHHELEDERFRDESIAAGEVFLDCIRLGQSQARMGSERSSSLCLRLDGRGLYRADSRRRRDESFPDWTV